MRSAKIFSGMALCVIALGACGEEKRMEVTPNETAILKDSSNAGKLSSSESREQVLKSFMGIPWTQTSGDIRATAKSQIEQSGATITKEESRGNATKYTIQGGSFKNYAIESGWIVAETGVGLQEANLILKPNGGDIETDYQNLVRSLTAEHGKTHESTPNSVNWYFYGDQSALLDLIKNPDAKNLRVQARSAKDLGNPYSWDHTGNQSSSGNR